MYQIRHIRRSAALVVFAAAATFALPAGAADTFKLGIVTFLSGPAAESFGVPARNGAQFVIDQLNKGAAPAPYDKVGFGGLKIEVRHRRGRRRHQASRGIAQPLRARPCRRGPGLCQFGRLPGGLAGRRGAQEASRPLRLRHAAHLRGEQIQLRLSHRRSWRDG